MKKSVLKLLMCVMMITLTVLCFASCEELLAGVTTTHNYSDWDADTATCTEGGTQTRECLDCGEKEIRKTAALGHDIVNYDDKAPTCTEPGYDSYVKCSRCDYSEGTVIDPTGHDLGEWKDNTALCLQGGEERRECKNCDYEETRETPQLGHKVNEYGVCSICKERNILVLIENGKANFNVVYTAKSGVAGRMAADSFVAMLRRCGIEVNDPVTDGSLANVTDCEIIIGANARYREGCEIKDTYLGIEGEAIKYVGKKVIIAGGTPELTKTLFDKFINEQLGLSMSTETIGYLQANTKYFHEKITDYIVDSITIGSLDLSEYKYVIDISTVVGYGFDKENLEAFHDALFDVSGYWLDEVKSYEMTSFGHYFIVRYTDDAGEDGFRAYVDGNNFIIECAYKNVFDKTFAEYVNSAILNRVGDITFASDYIYEKCVSKVYYEDFGAVGDGVTCDFWAIYDTHMFANQGGQKVCGKEGAIYKISSDNFLETIPVQTDVDFCGATFIVDDTGSTAYRCRKHGLFTLTRDYADRAIYTNTIKNLTGSEDVQILCGTTSIPWLAEILQGKSLLKIVNSAHRDFIRHGSNENSGAYRTDMLIVDKEGNISPDTPVSFDFESISAIYIYRVDDKPITIENGKFYNICCKTVAETDFKCKFHEYKRGFAINRSNVTINNITHEMMDEPEFGYYNPESEYVEDSLYKKFGSRYESYPYYGFFYISHTYNLNINDSIITGHTTYYEDKPATASTGGKVPDPVPMGTYDYVIEYSSNVTFTNVDQKVPETGLGDQRYWGVMSSNGSKNLKFEDCEVNRFDAHRGFWNATLINTTIGHSFNVVGGGTLIADGVKKLTGGAFISLRGDYGATFNGDMILKNCVLDGYKSYRTTNNGASQSTTRETHGYIISSGYSTNNSGWSSTSSAGAYWLWNFGYDCYMPQNITLDNFKSNTTNVYLFNNLPDVIFTKTYVEGETPTSTTVRYPYIITKNITYKNLVKDIPVCRYYTSSTYSKLTSIPITKENVG